MNVRLHHLTPRSSRDRSPLPRWSVGRVTLSGNSCHPMPPFMGQGAAQAIEDAATLKSCLLQHPRDIPAALRLYERLRLPRCSRLQGVTLLRYAENRGLRSHDIRHLTRKLQNYGGLFLSSTDRP